eukprot:3800721-Prymnesium_polylepis.1
MSMPQTTGAEAVPKETPSTRKAVISPMSMPQTTGAGAVPKETPSMRKAEVSPMFMPMGTMLNPHYHWLNDRRTSSNDSSGSKGLDLRPAPGSGLESALQGLKGVGLSIGRLLSPHDTRRSYTPYDHGPDSQSRREDPDSDSP